MNDRQRDPSFEALERRELLSVANGLLSTRHAASRHSMPAAAAAGHTHVEVRAGHPSAASPSSATFIDPTAMIRGPRRAITLGTQDYVGPFATVTAMRGGKVSIGNSSNVQDNAVISAEGPGANVSIGDQVIVAHNAVIKGPATIGAPGGAPAFIGFNAIIDGATVQPGAMVSSLARVAPGIVIPTDRRVLPGKFIQTQAEANDPALGKVEPVTSGDKKFMADVIHVNETLAAGYTVQALQSPRSVRGIGPNPPAPPFNPASSAPTLAGVPTAFSGFRNRIIGDVRTTDSLLQICNVMGLDDSIRADEASPFLIGKIARMGNRVTIHGLEYSALTSGHGGTFGFHSVVHGGSDSGQNPEETTRVGKNVRIGAWAVVFRSTIGNNSVIGAYAYVDGCQLAPGTVVPRGAIIINNQYKGQVEWI